MIKRAKLLIFIALASLLSFSSCANDNKGNDNQKEDDYFANEVLNNNETRVSFYKNDTYIRWKSDKNYDGYNIYKSPTKFGYYQKANSKRIHDFIYKVNSKDYDYYLVKGIIDGEEEEFFEAVSVFGKNTLICSEDDDFSLIQNVIDEKHDRLETGSVGQFSSDRFAVMFMPGNYSDVTMRLGYYTTAIGLGESPINTTIKELYVSTNVLSNNNATCTFWRNVENLSINQSTQFAVSQATSMRRCNINGSLALSHPSGWSSGGFLANTKVNGRIEARTQQQRMSRNDKFDSWVGSSFNYVFSGCEMKSPLTDSWRDGPRYTVVDKSPVIAEKPFLTYLDDEGYVVFVPSVRENTYGISWENINNESGEYISLDDFYIANADIDNSSTLNSALNEGKHLFFTPGIYTLDEPLEVKQKDTIILGVGYSTLRISDTNKRGALLIDDVDGVRVGNLLIDAGKSSKHMVVVGKEKSNVSHKDNPIVLSDLYLRIGGYANIHTESESALVINANNTIGDNFWLWRADHSRGVAWNDYENEDGSITYGNPCKNGLIVNGDDVTIYALMVEHFEEYQTIWNGERGKTIMYQSEVPYTTFGQDSWMSHDGEKNGYASYKVDDGVFKHDALGIGVYWVHRMVDYLDSAMEAPNNENINMYHLVTTTFSGNTNGGIKHVINELGNAVGSGGQTTATITKFPE